MLKALLSLLGKSNSGKSPIGGLALDIREAIKGKEMDPQRLIELQAEINKLEAQHRSLFVSGWRPSLGWVRSLAFAYHFVAFPIIKTIYPQIDFPVLETEPLFTVILGMLGLGGMRTFEKIKDKTR